MKLTTLKQMRSVVHLLNVRRPFAVTHQPGVSLLLIILLLSGCAGWFGFPAYFDPTTYKNLTDLKPQVTMLYESFTGGDLKSDKIDNIRLKLAQVYEYEKGKGEQNRETVLQLEIIRRMFERHVKDRQGNGPWSVSHMENQTQTISEAFDIAIQTENLKNKNR
jgi:hypothetical protein